MANFFTDNDDLQFYFDRGIDWAPLVECTEYGWRAPDAFKSAPEAVAFYRQVLETMGELAAEQVAPRSAQIDREDARLVAGEAQLGPAMTAVFDAFRQAELHGMCIPRELGGLNVPLVIYYLGMELLARADVSAMTHFSFHGGMALAMLAYSLEEGTTELDVEGRRIKSTRFQTAIEEIARGEAWGCMDITEPDAGSDMAQLKCKGEQDTLGRWFVTGNKIFITSGHGKYHFVIARTEEAKSNGDPFAGLGGLSMFLVQAYEDRPDGTRVRHVPIDRIEEKLGQHGSATAALSFDRVPAELIGKRGEGFKLMLLLMNNARVGVGMESTGLAECALRMAEAYANDRKSMGKPIAKHEMLASFLDEMKTDIQALRALSITSAYHEEMGQKLQILARFAPDDRLNLERDARRHKRRARRYTPLLKYLAAEKAVEIARRNLQIHGGVGYTRDYGAEKLLRDSLVMPIYEGTSQIQALMAMKDTLIGIVRKPRAFLARLGQASWRAARSRDTLERRVARLEADCLSVQQFLMTRTAAGKLRSLADKPIGGWRAALTTGWDPKHDFSLAMLHAERLTRLLADEAIAQLLLDQAKKFPERRELCERWLERAEPRSRALRDEITTTGGRILASLSPEPQKREGKVAS